MQEKIKEIFFYSQNIKLKGYIHIPSNDTKNFVIGSHGLLSDGNSGKQIDLAANLSKQNIGYLRFHHRGCGESEGNLSETDLNTRKKDLEAAFNFLKENYSPEKTGLFGSSMGGATCIFSHDSIKPAASVLLASPVLGATMEKSFGDSLKILMDETGLEKSFFIKNIDFDLDSKLDSIKNALVIHGDKDEIVPFENGEKLFSKIKEDKKFIRLENGNHRVEDKNHQKIFMEEAVDWFTRYLF